jgi:bacteriophage exclusion system BrxB-like protein
MPSRTDENLDQTFEDLFQVISSERFLQRRGLGNELPFFISAHHSSLEPRLEKLVPSLATRLSNHGVPVLLLNLYDLTVEILKTRGHWERLIEKEASIPRDRFLKTLQNVTDAKDQLVPLVAERLAAAPCRALLLSGVGLVFPYIRSHSVLENLQSVTKQTPTVLFFPGDYSFVDGKGSYLKLFGILPDDRYYRAFNVADFRP